MPHGRQVSEIHHDRVPILVSQMREARPRHLGVRHDMSVWEDTAANHALHFVIGSPDQSRFGIGRQVPTHIGAMGRGELQSAAGKVLAGFKASETASRDVPDNWHNKILWVDDRPENNVYERKAMESMGLEFTLALSTNEALDVLSTRRFAAIVSDMGRKEGPREGYTLLEALRTRDKSTPFFIYAGSNAPQHQREAALRGAQGSTNIAEVLVEMVTRSLPTGT